MKSASYRDPLLLYSRILTLRDPTRPLEISASIKGNSLLVCLNDENAFQRKLTHHQLLSAFNKIKEQEQGKGKEKEQGKESTIKFIRLVWKPEYIDSLYYIWHLDEGASQPMLVLYDPQTMNIGSRLIEHLNYGKELDKKEK